MAIDPVCRNYVNEQEAQHTATHRNTMYYFCCPKCRHKFEQGPEKYLRLSWWQRFVQRLQDASAKEFGGKRPSCH